MAMNLEAVLKIAAQVTGLQNITALEKGLQGAEKAASAAKGGFKAMLDSAAWQAAAAAAAGIGVALGLSVRAAMAFEESMAGVRKVVDGLDTPESLREIKAEIIDLSSKMPITAQGFADIYAAAGASGIAKGELKEFATMVAQVATAFDMTAAEAGTALAQLRVSLGMSTKEVASLADTMNYLDNSTGASAAQLVDFMSRSGAVGKIAGLTAEQTAGFGAAMIQAGTNTEVAATSFNNMIKALSKGPSMAERQVSALQRLGYAVVDAATEEQRLTLAVERESQRRIDAYREETDQLLKEVSRRYRSQLQQLQDGWEDEAKEYERSLQRKADAQMRAIQDSESLDENAKQSRINAIQDQLDEELTQYRRAQRDRQQEIRDQLDDQQDLEVKAAEQRFKAMEQVEKANADQLKKAAKKSAEDQANAWKQGFADRLQQDAIGTIMEVLQKIADLPKAQQVSVLSDLFGDEARGLNSLIANIGELDRVLAMSNDKTKAAGSVLKEYATRMETTAAQAKVAQNNVDAFAIAIGSSLLPAITAVLRVIAPLIQGFTWMVENIPGLGPAIAVLGTAFVGLVAAAPFISGFITLLGQLAPLFTQIGAIVAGLQTVFIVAFQGILTWIASTFIPAMIGFFSALTPAGWVALAIVGISLLAIAFRKQLGEMLTALWEWGEPIRKFWVDLWNTIKEPVQAVFDFIVGVVTWYGKTSIAVFDTLFLTPFLARWDEIQNAVGVAWEWIAKTAAAAFDAVITFAYKLLVQPWIDLWNNVLRKPIADAWQWIQGVWQTIVGWWNTYLVKPITNTWNAVMNTIKGAMVKTGEFLKGVWDGIIGNIKNVARSFLNTWINAINGVIRGVNTLINAFNKLPGADIPVIKELPKVAFAQGGVVKAPTLALIGEGGEPEYVIPESKMGRASANYLGGKRGGAVIPAFASGGYVGRQPYAMYRPGIGGREPEVEVMGIMEAMADAHKQLWEEYLQKSEAERKKQHQDFLNASKQRFDALKNGSVIEVTTGPVMEFDGSRFIAFEEFNKALQEVQEGIMRKAQDLMMDPFVNQWRGI